MDRSTAQELDTLTARSKTLECVKEICTEYRSSMKLLIECKAKRKSLVPSGVLAKSHEHVQAILMWEERRVNKYGL